MAPPPAAVPATAPHTCVSLVQECSITIRGASDLLPIFGPTWMRAIHTALTINSFLKSSSSCCGNSGHAEGLSTVSTAFCAANFAANSIASCSPASYEGIQNSTRACRFGWFGGLLLNSKIFNCSV